MSALAEAFQGINKPRKLWLLRFLLAVITFFVKLALTLYVIASIYNLFSKKTFGEGFLLGMTGLVTVWGCISALLIVELFTLFINIHDNVEDIRRRSIDPEFKFDLKKDRERENEKTIGAAFLIIIIVLAVILSLANFNTKPKSAEAIEKERLEREAGKVAKQRQQQEDRERQERLRLRHLSDLKEMRPSSEPLGVDPNIPAEIPDDFQTR